MARRYYRNGQATSLAFPVGALDTTIQVNSATSFPTQYPYTLILEPDGALEEVVDVTNGTGSTLTVTRGVDGTTASAHSAGVQVYHGVSARDPDEANAHVNATTNIHGITGSIVDTASSQAVPGAKDFASLKVAGSPVADTTSNQTIGGTKTFTSAPTFSAGQNVAGAESHTGAETHSGTETHSGAETHTGLVQFSNSVMRPTNVTSSVDDWTTSSTFVSTNTQPIVGLTFVAPPSGMVWVHLSAYIGQDNNQYEAIVSFRIGNGSTIGGGLDAVGPTGDRALVCGMAVNTAAPARLQAGDSYLIQGLTPGNTYNAHVMFATTAGGKCWVYRRTLDIIPIY